MAFECNFGNDHGCSSLSLLGVGTLGLSTLILDFELGLKGLAVSPVCPAAAQPYLVLIGWIPDGYSALRGIG